MHIYIYILYIAYNIYSNEYSFCLNIRLLFWYSNVFLASRYSLLFTHAQKLNTQNCNCNKMATDNFLALCYRLSTTA